MELSHVINKVLLIPKSFLIDDNSTIYGLLEETEYFQIFSKVEAQSIREILATKNEEIAQDWITYSANKRTPEGWYILSKNGTFEVGYFNGHSKENVAYFDEILDACTVFITNEIESIRLS